MFAFNKNSDKLREEIILIGFQVRPKGIEFSPYPKTGDFYIQIHKNDPWEPSCFGIESDKGSGRKNS